ncbi:hypothetical protein BDN70DRAFT_894172 [Pholiota conissans]|uniref:Uncharacterized protein n=1 Tax=Pholiota conissans TaxID=109636 RepID=A0A9P5Z3Y7_9AGAR|nr:hypothetical protein BDN70DRAFT_894172 [Pholiota conissans]
MATVEANGGETRRWENRIGMATREPERLARSGTTSRYSNIHDSSSDPADPHVTSAKHKQNIQISKKNYRNMCLNEFLYLSNACRTAPPSTTEHRTLCRTRDELTVKRKQNFHGCLIYPRGMVRAQLSPGRITWRCAELEKPQGEQRLSPKIALAQSRPIAARMNDTLVFVFPLLRQIKWIALSTWVFDISTKGQLTRASDVPLVSSILKQRAALSDVQMQRVFIQRRISPSPELYPVKLGGTTVVECDSITIRRVYLAKVSSK